MSSSCCSPSQLLVPVQLHNVVIQLGRHRCPRLGAGQQAGQGGAPALEPTHPPHGRPAGRLWAARAVGGLPLFAANGAKRQHLAKAKVHPPTRVGSMRYAAGRLRGKKAAALPAHEEKAGEVSMWPEAAQAPTCCMLIEWVDHSLRVQANSGRTGTPTACTALLGRFTYQQWTTRRRPSI